MGGLTGSGGGLTAEQQAQLQQMLKATSAPATSIPASLLSLGTPASGGLAPYQQRRLTHLTALRAAGTALSKVQQNRFTRLTALAKTAVAAVPPGQGLVRTAASNLARDANVSIIRRRGYKDTVATSPLGDAGFATNLSKPILTGQAA